MKKGYRQSSGGMGGASEDIRQMLDDPHNQCQLTLCETCFFGNSFDECCRLADCLHYASVEPILKSRASYLHQVASDALEREEKQWKVQGHSLEDVEKNYSLWSGIIRWTPHPWTESTIGLPEGDVRSPCGHRGLTERTTIPFEIEVRHSIQTWKNVWNFRSEGHTS